MIVCIRTQSGTKFVQRARVVCAMQVSVTAVRHEMHEKVSPTMVGESFERAATERRVVNGSDADDRAQARTRRAGHLNRNMHVHSC